LHWTPNLQYLTGLCLTGCFMSTPHLLKAGWVQLLAIFMFICFSSTRLPVLQSLPFIFYHRRLSPNPTEGLLQHSTSCKILPLSVFLLRFLYLSFVFVTPSKRHGDSGSSGTDDWGALYLSFVFVTPSKRHGDSGSSGPDDWGADHSWPRDNLAGPKLRLSKTICIVQQSPTVNEFLPLLLFLVRWCRVQLQI